MTLNAYGHEFAGVARYIHQDARSVIGEYENVNRSGVARILHVDAAHLWRCMYIKPEG